MIKDAKYFEEWERRLIASEPPDYERNLRIVEAMVAEARALGVWPPQDPLEGIEVDIRWAKALNAKLPS
jgi:hypothetical protein